MSTAIVTTKGRVTIPKSVRKGLGVEAGDRIEFVVSAEGVYFVVAVSRDVRRVKGLIARPTKPVNCESMKRAAALRAARRRSS